MAATLISPASKSRKRVAQVVETTRGETPTPASYKLLPYLENTSLDQSQTFERSGEIKSNRMGGKQVGGTIQVGGNLSVPLKHDDGVRELIESAISSPLANITAVGSNFSIDNISVQATGDITLSTGTSTSATLTINGIAFTFASAASLANDITIGTTAALMASNIATKLTAFSATGYSAINVATYTAGSGVVVVTYKTAGSGGNAFSLATTAGSGFINLSGAALTGGVSGLDIITRSSGSFIVDGFVAGAQVTLVSATTAGNNIGMSALVLIDSVTSSTITLSNASLMTTDEVFASATTLTQIAYYGIAASTRKFFTHEVTYLDMSPVVFEYFRGMEVNTWAINVPTSGEVTSEFAMIGLIGLITETAFDRSNNMSGTITAGTGTRAASASTVSFAGSVEGCLLNRGGSAAPEVESITINANNNRAAKFGIGQQTAAFVEEGDFDVEMTMALYFRDKSLISSYLAGTRTTLTVIVKDQQDGHRMIVELPNIVFTQASKGISGQTVVQNCTAFAEEDATLGTKMRVWIVPAVAAA